MKRNGAEIIIRALERQGIKIIAGIPGGANLPIYNALYKSHIRHILARHEQGAGFIAQGMARTTGKAAVCFATSGPGVTNLITAIADAKLDSVPLVAITGQVASSMIGTDAFQEVDTFGMTMNITKHNYLVKDVRDLPYIIGEAFRIAETGRPGPVLIDVPKDVQLAELDFDHWPDIPAEQDHRGIDTEKIAEIARIMNAAKRPLIYAGGGIVHAHAAEALYALAKKNSIPVVLTLMGLGVFPPDDPLYLGMLGMHGTPCTNYILDEIDLLLAFGARFGFAAGAAVLVFRVFSVFSVFSVVSAGSLSRAWSSRSAMRRSGSSSHLVHIGHGCMGKAPFPQSLCKSSGFLVRRSAATSPRHPLTALILRKNRFS